ncbi:MAG: efflux RND transporter periplasmic adaptor subunit [Bacteroidales bacterium]|nr:efflux RND transporter periplasmic adaptor subunit [Bacteroidales bacterium]
MMKYIILLIALAVASCQPEGDHEQGHTHDAGGGHHAAAESALTVDTTLWTGKTELFVEFPALVKGKVSRFAAHFTVMEKHRPVEKGTVTASLIQGSSGIRNRAEAPSSPGIFTPALKPKEAGSHRLVFDIESPQLTDRIVMKNVEVYSSVKAAQEALGEISAGDEAKISFLKEQAWRIPFQTTPAVKDSIYDIIPTSGTWQAAPGDTRTLSANASGIVGFAMENLTQGATVREGHLLMTLSSDELTTNNLEAKIAKARANFEQARSSWKRKKQLYKKNIASKSEYERAENQYRVAKVSYETLKAGYKAGGKQVRSPFGGFVKSINTANGDYAEEGAPLVTIGTNRSRLLKAHAGSSYASELDAIQNIFYQPEEGKWSSLKATGGKLLSVGKQVNHDEPMIPVFANVGERIEMPKGSFTEVQIAVGQPGQSIAIPESALLEDYGNYSVIVQLSGELFERRPVEPGMQNGDMVEITEGLDAGEIVVSTGAYQVKMASMSGDGPAHGHVH